MAEDFITVKVASMYYRITAEDDPDYVRQVAKEANDLLAEVKSRHPGLGDLAAAVLALLNSIDRGWKVQAGDHESLDALNQLQVDLDQSQAEILHLREQVWDIKKDLLYYRNLCDMYEERLQAMPKKPSSSSAKAAEAKARPLDVMQTSFEDMAHGVQETEE